MKHLMLATVASLALALPAMAQTNGSMKPGSQSQMSTQAQNEINPSQLDRQQIRHIQTALDQKGFNVRHVDGKWGPRTEAALKKFQQKQNLQGNGQLDQQTLAQLGVNANSSNTRRGSETTGAGSHENGMGRSSQNPGMTKPDRSNNQRYGSGSGTTGQGYSSGSQRMNQTPGQASGSMNDQSSGGTGNSAGPTGK